jgi:hypothetical protein
VESVHERPVAVTWFSRRWVTMTVVSGEAPTLGMASAMAVMTGAPPPSSSSTQEALVQWVNGTSLGGNGG